MTDKSIVDEMADAVACAEGEHRWAKVKLTVLSGRWECVACGFLVHWFSSGRVRRQQRLTVRERISALR